MAGSQGFQSNQTGGAPMNPGVQIPSMPSSPVLPASVQRVQGGFGISPQLLQMIAALQSRSQPQGMPGAGMQGGPFNPQQFMQKPKPPVIQNPYTFSPFGQPGGQPGYGGAWRR